MQTFYNQLAALETLTPHDADYRARPILGRGRGS